MGHEADAAIPMPVHGYKWILLIMDIILKTLAKARVVERQTNLSWYDSILYSVSRQVKLWGTCNTKPMPRHGFEETFR